MLIEVIILIILNTIKTQYSIDLYYPFLLDNAYSNITTIRWHYRDGFNVGFENKQIRRYSWDFSSQTSFHLSNAA